MRVLSGPGRGLAWIAGAGPHGIWLGRYETAVQRAVSHLLHEGDVFFDVGANAGFYSLLASRRVGAKGRVVAFEPLPANLALLSEHVRLNAVENIEILGTALAARSGRARFDPSPSRFTGHLEKAGSLEVSTISLDELMTEKRVPPPSVIKMDIEGGEAEALRGGVGLLKNLGPRVVLATHGKEVWTSCRRLLQDCGYSFALLSGDELSGCCEVLASRERRPGAETPEQA